MAIPWWSRPGTCGFWGIDAPEHDQRCGRSDGAQWACGEFSRDALVRAVRKQRVTCQSDSQDRYGRDVARCSVGTVDLGANRSATGGLGLAALQPTAPMPTRKRRPGHRSTASGPGHSRTLGTGATRTPGRRQPDDQRRRVALDRSGERCRPGRGRCARGRRRVHGRWTGGGRSRFCRLFSRMAAVRSTRTSPACRPRVITDREGRITQLDRSKRRSA